MRLDRFDRAHRSGSRHALALKVKDRKDEVRLAAAMQKLAEEDPSLTFVQDQASGEMKLFGQGEMHVRVALEKLAARFGVTVEAKKPSVSYRETIREPTTIRGRHKKQSGGHASWRAFLAWCAENPARLVLLTTRATLAYTEFQYAQGDILLVGRESAGVPQEVHDAADARVVVPMQPGLRSLNVAIAAAMVVGEALRQIRSAQGDAPGE